MANLPVVFFQSLVTSSTDAEGHLISFPLTSDKTEGCGFRGQLDPYHTIQYSTTMGCIGVIKLQGSLATDPTEEDWYDITDTIWGDGVTAITDGTKLISFNGNHVWIRAVIVSLKAGQINNISFTHN